MGIKTSIKKSQLPIKYQKYNLIPTVNGVMATVYLLDNIYVLKLFEKDTPIVTIESEIKLLNSLKNLPIPKVIDRFEINGLEVVIYTQIQGEIVSNSTTKHIKQLGIFLKDFHKQSRDIELKNQKLFVKQRLKTLIDSTKNRTLLQKFNNISLKLNQDGVIHGDLFIDNCKFKDNKLSGVYDFSDACLGDFYFDLAVIVIGCCFNKSGLDRKKVEALLSGYEANIKKELFDEYIKYALLYYATTRFIAKRDYREFLSYLVSMSN